MIIFISMSMFYYTKPVIHWIDCHVKMSMSNIFMYRESLNVFYVGLKHYIDWFVHQKFFFLELMVLHHVQNGENNATDGKYSFHYEINFSKINKLWNFNKTNNIQRIWFRIGSLIKNMILNLIQILFHLALNICAISKMHWLNLYQTKSNSIVFGKTVTFWSVDPA